MPVPGCVDNGAFWLTISVVNGEPPSSSSAASEMIPAATLQAKRSERDALEVETVALKREINRLRDGLSGVRRKERQGVADRIEELRSARAALEARVELLSEEITQMMRANRVRF
jgi:hypothetical protein